MWNLIFEKASTLKPDAPEFIPKSTQNTDRTKASSSTSEAKTAAKVHAKAQKNTEKERKAGDIKAWKGAELDGAGTADGRSASSVKRGIED